MSQPTSTDFSATSTGLSGEIGSSFDLAHRLTGEIAVGYAQRKYVDPRFDTLQRLDRQCLAGMDRDAR